MDQEKLTYFLALYGRYYPEDKIADLIERLKKLPEGSFDKLNSVPKKDPMSVLMNSLYLGYFGIDRMMIWDKGKGLLKLFIFGGMCLFAYFGIWQMNIEEISKWLFSAVAMGFACIWAFLDWFRIEKLTKEKNYGKIIELLEILEQRN